MRVSRPSSVSVPLWWWHKDRTAGPRAAFCLCSGPRRHLRHPLVSPRTLRPAGCTLIRAFRLRAKFARLAPLSRSLFWFLSKHNYGVVITLFQAARDLLKCEASWSQQAEHIKALMTRFFIFQWLLVSRWSYTLSSFPVYLHMVKCTIKVKKKKQNKSSWKKYIECFSSYCCKKCWGEYKVCKSGDHPWLHSFSLSRGFRKEPPATVGTIFWSSCLKF